jgi:CRP-like cAMP-binding protein
VAGPRRLTLPGDPMNDVDKLLNLYIFKGVPRRSLQELLILAPPVTFPRDSFVFRQGQATDVALLLISGRLAAQVEAGGEIQQVGDIRPGEIVGEQGLFIPGGKRSANVVALEASSALLLTPEVMDHAATNPAIVKLEQQLLGTIARRIRKTNTAIQQAWKADQESAHEPAESGPTMRSRLASLFGGR